MKYVDLEVFVGKEHLSANAPLDDDGEGMTRCFKGFPEPESDEELSKWAAELSKWHGKQKAEIRDAIKVADLTGIRKAAISGVRLIAGRGGRDVLLEQFGRKDGKGRAKGPSTAKGF